MLIKIPRRSDISESCVTDENVYHNRRRLLKQLGFIGAGSLLAGGSISARADWFGGKQASFATTKLTFSSAMQGIDQTLTLNRK